MSGQQTARSHLETACAETPRRAAKASCVIPMRRRKTASLSPNSVVNCILRLLILDIPQLPSGGYSGCHLPPRNCAASNLNIAVCYRGGDAHLCFISDTEFYRATSGREFPRKPQIIAHPMPFFQHCSKRSPPFCQISDKARVAGCYDYSTIPFSCQ